MTSLRFALFTTTLLAAAVSRANERIAPLAQLLKEGYQIPSPYHGATVKPLAMDEHSLEWPLDLRGDRLLIGNSMIQFQDFDVPGYWHGGCDVLVNSEKHRILAPIGGRLEAGHYSYSLNDDSGKLIKAWMPWPGQGDKTYFEIAIINAEGYRFEIHHIDRSSLPANIVALLNAGGGHVDAGTFLGHAVDSFGDYNHIHYNIVAPDGTRLNPEYFSRSKPDYEAPEVLNAFAIFDNPVEIQNFGSGSFARRPKEFVIRVVDRYFAGDTFDHAPLLAQLQAQSGPVSGWDFRRALVTEPGVWPRLFDFILKRITAPDGTRYVTGSGYGRGISLIRIPVTPSQEGPFEILLGDDSGNQTILNGVLPR
ncbi:MAG: hypothetical protein ABIR96_01560 [Bdellovibrionota bacterium]